MDYKLTQKSQEALSGAVRRAAADGHPEVLPAHLLVTLLGQTGGTAVPLLEAVGADVRKVRNEAERMLDTLPRAKGATVSAPSSSRSPIGACPVSRRTSSVTASTSPAAIAV